MRTGVEFAVTAFDLAVAESEAAAQALLMTRFMEEDHLSEEEATAKAAETEKSEAREKYTKSARSAVIMLSWQASGATSMLEISRARYALGR